MDTSILKRGAIAGVVGATVLALWFLGFDLVRGAPLGTPAFVAGALLGGPAAAAIPAYTVLHYMSFMVVGLTSAWVMARVRVSAPTLLGLALGFLLFDMIFYGSIIATGADVVGELGWRTVLLGNVWAGLAVTHTIHRLQAPGTASWLHEILQGPVVREGLLVGLVGAAAVALWFLALDSLDGRPFVTPSALGGLLAGQTDGAAGPVNVAWVAAYTVVHAAAFVVLGIVLSALSSTMEEIPALLFGALLGLVSLEAFAMGAVAVLSEFLPHAWWTFLGANLLATLAMGAVLWRGHPRLVAALTSDDLLAATD